MSAVVLEIVYLLIAERHIVIEREQRTQLMLIRKMKINYGHCSGVIFMPRFFQRFMRSIRSEGEDQYFIQRIWQSSGNFFQKCICLLLLRTIFGICG